MAHVQDRWMRKARDENGKFKFDDKGKPVLEQDPERYGKGNRWRVRYLDPNGKECSQSFGKKVLADRFKVSVEADVHRGTYIDPNAGKITFQKLAEDMLATRTLDPATVIGMRRRLVNHVFPYIGKKEIGLLSQRPSMLADLVKKLSRELAPTTIEGVMAHVGLVFSIAIADGLIAKHPLKSSAVVLPTKVRKKLVLWTAEQVLDVADALPGRYRAMVAAGAGMGLRQGEIFGLSPDDIDWLRGVATIQRQVKYVGDTLIFGTPKSGHPRDVPLSESVKVALAEHMRRYEPMPATLPWSEVDGPARTARLFFTNARRAVLNRNHFNTAWRRATCDAGVATAGVANRQNGCHMLRHFFASSLLTDGESVQAVSEWLGHADPSITLQAYAHCMPSSESRMRRIIDAALTRPDSAADGPDTARALID